jgi:hypothetical protein
VSLLKGVVPSKNGILGEGKATNRVGGLVYGTVLDYEAEGWCCLCRWYGNECRDDLLTVSGAVRSVNVLLVRWTGAVAVLTGTNLQYQLCVMRV